MTGDPLTRFGLPEAEAAPRAETETFSRRRFLIASAVTIGGVALAGYVGIDRSPAVDPLQGFIDLSRVVTGVDELPAAVAGEYLDALEQAGLPVAPSELVRLAGYSQGRGPATLDELEASAVFSRREARSCADAIAAAWWSGIVPTKVGETRVVSYLDALVWRTLPYAQPPSNCLGVTGAWAARGAA